VIFDPEFVGNQLTSQTIKERKYQGLKIQKGDELGMFRMGSTVVMLYSPGTIQAGDLSKFIGKPVKVNSDFSQ
jgi:phosphatidylserine decarboxylase